MRDPGVIIHRHTVVPATMRKKVLIKWYENGRTVGEAAVITGINNMAKSVIDHYKKNGCVDRKKRGSKRNSKLNASILNKIEQIIEENPCVT